MNKEKTQTLTAEDLKKSHGYESVIFAEKLLKNPQPDFKKDYLYLLEILKNPKRFGVFYTGERIVLSPIDIKNICFKKAIGRLEEIEPPEYDVNYFTHITLDSGLKAIKSPEDVFTYISTSGNYIECGNVWERPNCQVIIDAKKLSDERSIFLDPESLEGINEHELGKAFMILGGIPEKSIIEIKNKSSSVIRKIALKLDYKNQGRIYK